MIGLLDHYVTGVPLLVFGVLQPVVICWVYGYSRFEADLSVMLGKKPWKWWQLMWQVVTPLLILVRTAPGDATVALISVALQISCLNGAQLESTCRRHAILQLVPWGSAFHLA